MYLIVLIALPKALALTQVSEALAKTIHLSILRLSERRELPLSVSSVSGRFCNAKV
jgi:hypothetical protein